MSKKYMDYVKENLIDDVDDVYSIAELASKEIARKFDIEIKVPEMLITVFSVSLRDLLELFQEKEKAGYPKFKAVIADRFEMGYDNAANGEYEVDGSFTAYIKHLYHKDKGDAVAKEYGESSIELATKWNSINIKGESSVMAVKDLIPKCLKDLKKLDIGIESGEIIMPLVVTFYDAMIAYVTTQRASLKEFEYGINMASLFDVKALENGDTDEHGDSEDIIEFTPSIEFKLGLKDNAKDHRDED